MVNELRFPRIRSISEKHRKEVGLDVTFEMRVGKASNPKTKH